MPNRSASNLMDWTYAYGSANCSTVGRNTGASNRTQFAMRGIGFSADAAGAAGLLANSMPSVA